MLTLIDGVARLKRYRVEYEEALVNGGSEPMTDYAVSKEALDVLLKLYPGAPITEIDQTGNEWIDGMAFPSRDAAIAALGLGEEGYRKKQRENDPAYRLDQIEAENIALMLALTELFEHVLEEGS